LNLGDGRSDDAVTKILGAVDAGTFGGFVIEFLETIENLLKRLLIVFFSIHALFQGPDSGLIKSHLELKQCFLLATASPTQEFAIDVNGFMQLGSQVALCTIECSCRNAKLAFDQ
jgi:hypothetical protein